MREGRNPPAIHFSLYDPSVPGEVAVSVAVPLYPLVWIEFGQEKGAPERTIDGCGAEGPDPVSPGEVF